MFFNDFFINISLTLAAFLLSFSLFPFSLRFSRTLGAIDLPNSRKIHSRPTARAGGVAFFISFSFFLLFIQISLPLKLSLLIGGALIFLIGLFDDAKNLSPMKKFTGQAAAASIPIFFGIDVYNGKDVFSEFLFGFLSVFWIIFLTNAINLSDGLDGLAAGSSASFSFTLALFSLIIFDRDVFWLSLLLAFSILGFIPHNRHPAKIFMGDCGSLFIGYALSLLSLKWIADSPSLLHAIAVIILFLIPISDTVQSFFRRIFSGKSPFSADRGHFHHRLLDNGFTVQTSALAIITASAFFELVAVLILSI